MKQLYVKNVNGIFTPIDDVPAASVQADAASCDSGCRLNPTGDPQNDCGNCALATVPQDIGRDAALAEPVAKIVEWLIAQGHMDWRSDGVDESGHEDGFNSNEEEAATLRYYVKKAALAALAATPPANVAPEAPSTLAQQVASAQSETEAWPDGKLARVKLAGGDQP